MELKDCKVILTCGMIGSGKTTWIKSFIRENPQFKVISKDDIRRMLHCGEYVYDEKLEGLVESIAQHTLNEALWQGLSVIIDGCHVTEKERWDTYHGWQATGIVCWKPIGKAYHVSRRMNNSYGVIKEVWENVYDKMISKWKEPTLDECHVLKFME